MNKIQEYKNYWEDCKHLAPPIGAPYERIGAWCPVCEILSRGLTLICGLCNTPMVPMPRQIIDKFIPKHSNMIKIDKGSIVEELI